jgi:hypothetical protein
MAYALLGHAAAGAASGNAAATTAGFDTTGATLLTAAISDYSADSSTLSDSKVGNTWTPLTLQTSGPSRIRIYYCVPTSVGSGHTATATPASFSYCTVAFAAWSGAHATPFDTQNGAAGVAQPGSVTPSVDNCLIFQALTHSDSAPTINGGYTVLDTVALASSVHFGIGVAYLIQTTAGATNPTWVAPTAPSASCAVFKPSLGGGGGRTTKNTRANNLGMELGVNMWGEL